MAFKKKSVTVATNTNALPPKPVYPKVFIPYQPMKPTSLAMIKKEKILFSKEFSDFDNIKLLDLTGKIPENISLDSVMVRVKKAYYHGPQLSLFTEESIVNPSFEKDRIKYEEALKKYDEDMALFTKADKEYKKEIKMWDKLYSESLLFAEKERLQQALSSIEAKIIKKVAKKKKPAVVSKDTIEVK